MNTSTATPLAAHAPQAAAKGVEVIQLAEACGAEVRGIDMVNGVDEAGLAVLRDALNKHAVVLIRGQKLTPAQQTAFTKQLGEMRTSFYNRYGVPEHPELSIVSNIKREDGEALGIADAGMLWHTDASYLPTPDLYTLLYGITIPHRDGNAIGDTVFSSTGAAYDDLPADLRKRLDGMRAVHSFTHHLDKKKSLGQLKRAPLSAEQKAALPDVSHPVVRRHPNTGRACLFVTEGHTYYIEGLPEKESVELLEMLYAHIKNPQFHYRHTWQANDMLIWDNPALQHLAIFDYGDIPRRLHRAGILGPVPQPV